MIRNVLILAMAIVLLSAYVKIDKLTAHNTKLQNEASNVNRTCKITQNNVTHKFQCEIVDLNIAKAEF